MCCRCASSELCRKLIQLDAEMKQLHDELLTSTNRVSQLKMDKSSLDTELRRMEAMHDDKERECQIVVKDYEYAKERETVMLVDR